MKMTENTHFLSEMDDDTPSLQIRDDLDFPHSGIFKALHLATKGTYIIKESNTDFDIAQSDGGSFTVLTIKGGAGFRNGKYAQIGSGSGTDTAITMNTAYNPGTGAVDITPHATLDVYLLLVGNASNAIVLRGSNAATGKVPEYVDGDIPIAVIKVVAGTNDDATGRPIQYLTTNQDDNSLSIGYASSDNYVEALSVSSDTSGDVTIENKVSDKDMIFKVNDGGSSTEIMRFDGSTARVGIGGADTTPDAMLHLKSSVTSQPEIRLQNTTSDSQEACIRFMKSAGSGGSDAVADNDDLGLIRFEGDDDAGNNTLYSYISADVKDASNGDEAGRVNHYIMQNGANSIYLQLSGDGGNVATGHVTVNPSGGDVDFIVEGDTAQHLIHTDAGNDRVAILGDGTPTQTLELNGSFAGKVTTITGTTASYSVVATDYTIIGHSTATPCTVTLPAASANPGRILNFHQLDSGGLLLAFNGSDEISGHIAGANQDTASGAALAQYQGFTIVSDGVSRWCCIGQSGPQA
jgi:hypothetical protein